MINDSKTACPFVTNSYLEELQKSMKRELFALKPHCGHQVFLRRFRTEGKYFIIKQAKRQFYILRNVCGITSW